jgi:hypothetical protein
MTVRSPRPILVVLLVIAIGLVTASLLLRPTTRNAAWWEEVYGEKADGSSPLKPGQAHIGLDGNIYWTSQ